MNLSILGKKISTLRTQLEITHKEITDHTKISENILQSLENGETKPTGNDLLKLADFFKCDYNYFLNEEKKSISDQTQELFRKHGSEINKADRWAIQEFLFLCENEAFLGTELNRIHNISFQCPPFDGNYKKHGKETAIYLKKHLNKDFNNFGVDIFDDIRNFGYHFFRRKLNNSNISGLTISHPTAGICILVNYSEDIFRQRFTAAHELAHALIDFSDSGFNISFDTDNKNLKEIRANNFASHYLICQETIKSFDFEKLDSESFVELAIKFKVNAMTLAIYLKDLNKIDDNKFSEFKNIVISKNKKEDPELPENLSVNAKKKKKELLCSGLSNYYVNLCFDAYNHSIISRGRLVENLLLESSDQLSDFCKIYNIGIEHGF